MARGGRYFLPEQPLHVIQRGNNREAIFFDDIDYERYADWLAAAATAYRCAVHAYVLMTNHVQAAWAAMQPFAIATPPLACGAPAPEGARRTRRSPPGPVRSGSG
jgi:putative transposase